MISDKPPKGRDIRQAFQRSNKKAVATTTQGSSGTDSFLFPHTGHRLGTVPTTDNTHTFPQPSCSANSHTGPVTTIVLDTSSESDIDTDLAGRMALKRWSVNSGIMGHEKVKRRYVSSSDTDSDRHELHHPSSIASHKKCRVTESETGKTQGASCSQGQGHDRNASETEVTNTDVNTCAATSGDTLPSGDTRVECPNCGLSVTASSINQHLDECLT